MKTPTVPYYVKPDEHLRKEMQKVFVALALKRLQREYDLSKEKK